jgi:hypothetical protein
MGIQTIVGIVLPLFVNLLWYVLFKKKIIGMTLAWAQVLMLPLDVANSR